MSNAELQLHNIDGYKMCKQHPLGKVRSICIYAKTCYDVAIIAQKFNYVSILWHFGIKLNLNFVNNSSIAATICKNLRIHQLLILIMNFKVIPHILVIENLQFRFVMTLIQIF